MTVRTGCKFILGIRDKYRETEKENLHFWTNFPSLLSEKMKIFGTIMSRY